MVQDVPAWVDDPAVLETELAAGRHVRGVDYSIDRPHGLPQWILVHTEDGRGVVSHRGHPRRVAGGDVFIVRPGEPHAWRTDPQEGTWVLSWVYFRPLPRWNRWLRWPGLIDDHANGVQVLHLASLEVRDLVTERVIRAAASLRSGAPLREMIAACDVEAVLLLCDAENPRSAFGQMDVRIRRCIDHIVQHLDQPLTLAALARVAHLSPGRLLHLFTDQVGVTPRAYVEGERMHRARQQLRLTDRTVAEIASSLGYASPFYFSSRFKQAHGVPPTGYRKHPDAART